MATNTKKRPPVNVEDYQTDDRDRLDMFRFHLTGGGTLDIWAMSKGDAVRRFRTMMPEVTFVTDDEMTKKFKPRPAVA